MKYKTQTLCEYPEITLIEDFITDEECTHLIENSKDRLTRSTVDGTHPREDSTRTSSQCWIQHDMSPMVTSMCERIAEVVGIPLENAEPLQMVYYRKGQEYKPHHDSYDLSTDYGQRATKGWGQRLKTALLYLNDVEEGGETEFPMVDVTVKPKRGSLVVFQNIDTEAADIPLHGSMHAALPVISGFKWACNLWFHERSSVFQNQEVPAVSEIYMSDEECVRMLETIATATTGTYDEHSRRMEYIAKRFQELTMGDESKFK